MTDAKQWTHSRTLAFNLLALLTFALALPETGKVIPSKHLPYVGIVVAVGNKILRFRTTVPVTTKRRRTSRAKRPA